jgi:hypothetical protein
LEVVVYFEGGRRSRIVIPEGRKGFGWRRFADELSKVKVFFEDLLGSAAGRMERPLVAPLTKGKRWGLEAGAVPSFAEVVRTAVPSTDKKRPEAFGMMDSVFSTRELDLFPLGVIEELPVLRSAVNCYDLEMVFPDPLGKNLREDVSPRV